MHQQLLINLRVLARNKADFLALNEAHVLSQQGAFALALNIGHIFSLRRKTCVLSRAKTSTCRDDRQVCVEGYTMCFAHK